MTLLEGSNLMTGAQKGIPFFPLFFVAIMDGGEKGSGRVGAHMGGWINFALVAFK